MLLSKYKTCVGHLVKKEDIINLETKQSVRLGICPQNGVRGREPQEKKNAVVSSASHNVHLIRLGVASEFGVDVIEYCDRENDEKLHGNDG